MTRRRVSSALTYQVTDLAYRDLSLGVVDASIIALAERLGEPKVATLDQSHCRTVGPAHFAAFELLP